MKYLVLTIAGVVLISISQHISGVPDMAIPGGAIAIIGGALLGHVAVRAADH